MHSLALAGDVDDVVERGLALVDVGDELADAALVVEGFLVALLALVVGEGDAHAAVEEGELAQAVGQGLPLEAVAVLEDLGVGHEGDGGAGGLGVADLGDGAAGAAALVALAVDVAIALDLHFHPLGEGVHAADTDAVEAAGDLVAAAAELAAGVEDGHHHLEGGFVHLGVLGHGDAAAVVLNGQGAVGVDGHLDVGAEPGQRFVDGVVHHLVDQVMVAALGRIADVHRRAHTHRFKPLQHLDGIGVIVLPLSVLSLDFFVCHG